TRRAHHRAQPVEPRDRNPLRPPPAAVGPARVGRARTGCRCRHVHLPRGDVSGRGAGQSRVGRRGRDHHRQAAQRADGHGEAGVPQAVHAVREPGSRHLVGGAGVIRQTVAVIDRSAIAANCRAITEMLERESAAAGHVAPGLVGVVKANGYGHGAVEVAATLEEAGVAMLACADIEEGVELRRSGVASPILVFGALSVSDLEGIVEYRLTPTVSTPAAARALADLAERRGIVLSCHLKIDSGMNRLGFRHDNLARTMPDVLRSRHLRLEAVYTQFATADVPELPYFDEQRRAFDRATAALGAMGLGGIARHAANSAALLRDARTWYDYVRPGLLIYGIVPPPLASSIPLRPALSLTSRIVAVKGVRVGEGVGYGRRWTAGEPRTIAIVPAGYA